MKASIKHMKLYFVLAVTVLMLCTFEGCTGKRPFLIVEVCLNDEKGLEQFTDLMRSIAQSEHLKFIDGSAETQHDLTMLKANKNARAINLDIEREDGLGVGAGNLGLPTYQVALGFSEGSNSLESRKFADMVIGELKKKWNVEDVPSGQGAQPMKACGLQK